MQLLSAFSRPQTVPVIPAPASRKNLWILSSWRDLLFYVGTPALLKKQLTGKGIEVLELKPGENAQ